MEKSRWDLRDEKYLKKIKTRIDASFYKFTRTNEGAEDCAQEIITRMLDGKHQHATIDQCVIDYLRKYRNHKGFSRGFEEQDYPVTNSYEHGSFDRFIADDSGRDVGMRIDADRIIGMSKHWERAVMTLFFMEEYGKTEIGYLFGVTESRVNQWLQRIQGRISTRITQETSRQEKRSGTLEKLLPEEAGRDEWAMEFGQSYTVEKFTSFGMDSFTTKSF